MWYHTYSGDPETPDEWEPSDPIWCAECGTLFDIDDLNELIKEIDGLFYVCFNCLEKRGRE